MTIEAENSECLATLIFTDISLCCVSQEFVWVSQNIGPRILELRDGQSSAPIFTNPVPVEDL